MLSVNRTFFLTFWEKIAVKPLNKSYNTDFYGISCFSVFFSKKDQQKVRFATKNKFYVFFIILQKHAGAKIRDQKNKKT